MNKKVMWAVMTAELLASAARAQVPEPPRQKQLEFIACFNATRAVLEEKRVTPERYQMAIEGACLREEQASLDEFEAYLRSWDRGNSDITAKTMEDTRGDYRRFRAQAVSKYTVAYETSGK